MQSFLISTAAVALAEVGDKTQLLALVLACRYRKPWPIILGILVATLANHGAAAWLGAWVSELLGPDRLRIAVGASFLAVAAWTLVPDKLDEDEAPKTARGAFLATLVSFFLVEIGDKTQVATVVLAAKLDGLAAVVLGTTTGMLLANVPVVLLGHVAATRIPVNGVRIVAAASFAVLGVLALLGIGL